MTISSFIFDWKVKLAGFIILLVMALSWHKVEVTRQVEAARFEAKQETRDEVARKLAEQKKTLKKESDDTQKALEATHRNHNKEKDANYKRIIAQRDADIKRLSERPDRPVQSSTNSKYGLSLPPSTKESTGYVDGSGLFRADAVFLERYSVRTEGLKLELQTCYAAYDEAKRVLDEFKDKHSSQ